MLVVGKVSRQEMEFQHWFLGKPKRSIREHCPINDEWVLKLKENQNE